MERRVFIAILLSLGVLFVYQTFAPKTPPPTTATAPAPASAAALGVVAVAPDPAVVAPAVAGAALPTDAVAARDVRVETTTVIATFTSRGGRLKSWKLKKYRDRSGDPLELIATDLAATQPLPFTLLAADDPTTAILNSAVYTVGGNAESASPTTGAATVTFDYRSADGLSVSKAFAIDPSSYTVTLRTAVTRGGAGQSVAVVWGPGLGDTDSQTGRYAVKPEVLFSVAGKVSRVASTAIVKQPSYQQEFEYVGIDDHYFASLALKPGTAAVNYSRLAIPPPAGTKDPARELVGYTITPSRADTALTFYVGPKDFDTLASIDVKLTKAINFGMFSVIVVPLLRSLQWIHDHMIANYGWAITLLTLFINVVLFPLNYKSMVSMRKMQEVQPEAKAIQERYAKLKTTDPARQKMNQELMALYKERGVNPASGCIPILLTLPVFLAFYAMLSTAIELRGAPFVGWVHDLSMPDPYYVLPILVAISQFATQWMTPQPGVDPAQQKMMLVMPLVLGFVFLSSPAGALIYWFVSSAWRIGQMQLTNYMMGPPPNVRTATSAAERKVKRVGQGKADAAREEQP